jgi:hypothetical protein
VRDDLDRDPLRDARLLDDWDAVRATVLARATQTNEVGRCATLLPVLAGLPGPLALIEVGASAGLCLYPDRCSYRYSGSRGDVALDPAAGPSPVVLECRLDGDVPLPDALPDVVWRGGVDLYPLDVERAFRLLNKIKPHVNNWIAQTPQTISLIQTNELDFTYAYKSRVLSAQESGVSMDIVDTHPLVTNTYVCVGKGTRNKTVVMRFLNELLSPEMQAAFVNYNIGNGPITNNAGPLIKPDVAKLVPDLKSPKVALTDDAWWADNYEKVAPRLKEWLLTG